jgi:hypothetical protein
MNRAASENPLGLGLLIVGDRARGAAQMNKVLGLAAIFAIAVLAGCSSPSPESSPTTGKHLEGTMDEWVNAVCTKGGPLPMNRGRMLGNSTAKPLVCYGVAPGSRSEIPIYIGTYPSESSMDSDLNPYMTGTYAEGNNGSDVVVFVSLPIAPGTSVMFQPLEAYGFTIHQVRNPSVEPAPPQPLPGSTNAMPPQTPTHTAAEPPATTAAAQPYWDGPWLRNYWEDDQDCTSGGLDYWVVQPGTATGMFTLRKGCFPPNWLNALTTHCESYNWSYNGQCAVWDQGSIMSTYKKHGDLQIVRLKQDCLASAGLTDFHEGPIHQYCVIGP